MTPTDCPECKHRFHEPGPCHDRACGCGGRTAPESHDRLREAAQALVAYADNAAHYSENDLVVRIDALRAALAQPAPAAPLDRDKASPFGDRISADLSTDACRESLESMVHQFAYWSDGALTTGGLSALEDAFVALGWSDPHPVPESCCAWPQGCKKRGEMGTPVSEDDHYYGGMRYVWTCWDHSPEGLRRSGGYGS